MRMLQCLSLLAALALLCPGCQQESYVKKKTTTTMGGPIMSSDNPSGEAHDPDSPFANVTLDVALAKAKAENKLVFVDFYADWCGPCKMLDRTTWKDAKVKEWLSKHTIAVKVDVDRDAASAQKYKVEAMPTMILLAADGKEKKRIVGYRDAQQFITEFGRATN